uniref:Uncharacterized protein n=2 Tax=Oryza punctata TaxID=4537 RepID=A0A0E0KMF6_ORYPU
MPGVSDSSKGGKVKPESATDRASWSMATRLLDEKNKQANKLQVGGFKDQIEGLNKHVKGLEMEVKHLKEYKQDKQTRYTELENKYCDLNVKYRDLEKKYKALVEAKNKNNYCPQRIAVCPSGHQYYYH